VRPSLGYVLRTIAGESSEAGLGRLDFPRIGIGVFVTAALAVGLGIALLRHAQSTPDSGPTAGALDDGLSYFFGGGLGLALGSALCALWVRRGSPILSGLLAGVVAYVVILVPLDVLSRPNDVSLGEAVGGDAWFAIFAAAFALLGGALGSFIVTACRRAPGL
jgi:hypothetical protein